MRPSIYRAAAAELMEMGRLTVQSGEMAALILAEFDAELQTRVSARRVGDRWEMTFDQRVHEGR